MNYKKILFGIAVLFVISSCKKDFDNLLVDPNNPTPAAADVDLFLNQTQVGFNLFLSGSPSNLQSGYYSASDLGAHMSRQQYVFFIGGPFYRSAYQPQSFDPVWDLSYSSDPTYGVGGVINTANTLIPLAEEEKKYVQAGIARVLEAYTYGTLVDLFGDVPYSEANGGASNPNPKVDGGASVYEGIQSMLDSAISDFQKTGAAAGPANDMFYNGDINKWISAAKTLKLKFYMQVRLVDNSVVPKIAALISENDLINDPSKDFVFRYGTSVSPDSRHPHYAVNYTSSGNGAAEYLSNYFMWMVTAQKYGGNVTINSALNTTTGDPRARYYFYRQQTNYNWANPTALNCYAKWAGSIYPAWYPSVPDQTCYCLVGAATGNGRGYFGRDFGDNSGSNPNAGFTTTYGVYPAGGAFDDNSAGGSGGINNTFGAKGAGIFPIWLSSYTTFLEAEAALVLGITTQGDARTLLKNGVDASIKKVMNFPGTVGVTPDPSFVPTATQVTNYENLVLSNYDSSSGDDEKLNSIMTEYYIALWGNGIEPYNNLRRTGKPENVQIPVAVPAPGHFIRSFFYPSVFVNRNLNAPAQKDPGNSVNKVFWDNNPDDFIK
ncbi:MAG TPA: SusD/RagB family nutrient-binding outer membrane lipoprotein [Puia sp.]|nr:SusD/RagB family nutrient-binding outer membrane lipoprotein [Puia sp.]